MAEIDPHATIEELLEAMFSVRSVPRLYNEDQLPLRVSREGVCRQAILRRQLGGWCEMAASLRGLEPGSRGTSAVGRRYQTEQ
jgi:hypothetical protein